APAPPPVVEEEEFALGDEEEIPFGGDEDIPVALDEPAPARPAPAIVVADEESLDLDQEMAGGSDLPSQFIDDEPMPADESDLALGFDEAALDEPIAAESAAPAVEEEVGFGVEDEFPLDEPAPAPPPPPPPPPRAAKPAPPPPRPAPAPVAPPVAAKPAAVKPPAPAKPAPAPVPPPAPRVERAPAPRPTPPSPPPPPPAPVRMAPAPAPPKSAVPKAAPVELRAAPLARSAPAPATGRIPVELIRLLEEVESYVSLGFVDDAKEALREGSVRFAGHPILVQKMAELGLDDSAPEPEPAEMAAETDLASELDLDSPAAYDPLGDLTSEPPPEPEPEPEPSLTDDLLDDAGFGSAEAPPEPGAAYDETSEGEELLSSVGDMSSGVEGMDLGSELGELFGAQSAVEESHTEGGSTELGDAGLADIFKEFKKGVDKQLGKEDYDTRYNLGIAYKEMGLIDEAIAEFQLAAKDEARLLECSSMLGICFLDKGMPKLAMKWFERGLKAPGRTDEEYAALRYDLAMAHEAAGDVDKALSMFTELYGQDANFRDVANKVRDLRAMAQG
ncbi:MAG TPA: hypothetical protein VGQ33_11200, partial [Vicinamibacteria bacterium]|nr:hypothetical protein [Vicinamibacteria bacterium]